jgi:hypothetical protein
MTRTFKTLAALAVICVSAPAFAHGGGHGGPGNGGMGNQGMGNNQHNGQATPIGYNIVTNKGTQTTTTTTTTGSHHDMMGSHHDRHDRKILVKNQKHIQRLEAEVSRLIQLVNKETSLNHPAAVAKLLLDLKRVVRELNRDGAVF